MQDSTIFSISQASAATHLELHFNILARDQVTKTFNWVHKDFSCTNLLKHAKVAILH